MSNQKCMIQPTIINLHPNKYSQEFVNKSILSICEYKLDRCVGSCNTLNNLSNKVCIPHKTNQSVLNIITGINESKT